jgi:hypothetical protein
MRAGKSIACSPDAVRKYLASLLATIEGTAVRAAANNPSQQLR